MLKVSLTIFTTYLLSRVLFTGYSGLVSDNKPITVMPVWGPGFELSLDFYIHSLVQGNSNGFAWMFAMR